MTRQIRLLGLGLIVCFCVLFVQLNRLTIFQADELNANPANTRDILRDFSQPRGSVATADGVVIARSVPVGRPLRVPARVPRGPAVRPRHRLLQLHARQLRAWRRPTTTSWPAAPSTCRSRTSPTCSSTRTASATSPSRVRADLQQIASDQLGEREGSVVALDPRTGEILDPRVVPHLRPEPAGQPRHGRGDGRRRRLLDADPNKPRLARSYQDRYFPGSTFKVVTATAGILYGGVTADEPVYPREQRLHAARNHPPDPELRRLDVRRRAVRDPADLVQHRLRPDGRRHRRRAP